MERSNETVNSSHTICTTTFEYYICGRKGQDFCAKEEAYIFTPKTTHFMIPFQSIMQSAEKEFS